MPRRLLTLLGLLAAALAAAAQQPLPRAHAHNDYEHTRPLLDALDQGFTSVEADIYLVDGQLLVAHDRPKVKPERTLEALYLDPLRDRVRAHHGRVYRDGPPFTLLIDLKSDGSATYQRLREVLADYRPMLTAFTRDRTETNAITVILSGDRPWDLVAGEQERLVALDGRLTDLARDPLPNRHLVPLVSDNWQSHFRWKGVSELPLEERTKLAAWVRQAHDQGRRIRFWGAPDVVGVWQAHLEAGVDLINTDRLADLATFLRSAPARPPGP